MAKKTARKSKGARKTKSRTPSRTPGKSKAKAPSRARRATPPSGGDRSKIDLKPLKEQIRRRIADLKKEGPQAMAASTSGLSADETINRLERVLDTLAEICFPSMDVPI